MEVLFEPITLMWATAHSCMFSAGDINTGTAPEDVTQRDNLTPGNKIDVVRTARQTDPSACSRIVKF